MKCKCHHFSVICKSISCWIPFQVTLMSQNDKFILCHLNICVQCVSVLLHLNMYSVIWPSDIAMTSVLCTSNWWSVKSVLQVHAICKEKAECKPLNQTKGMWHSQRSFCASFAQQYYLLKWVKCTCLNEKITHHLTLSKHIITEIQR